MDAAEAERLGLVSRVVPASALLAEARTVAEDRHQIPHQHHGDQGGRGNAFETSLSEGLLFERRTFHALFATQDQKEGMAAFVEKRPPQFRDG